MHLNTQNKAFTLVELAIVIVIIGLLVSGVLAGQELIKQAEIRKNVKKIQEVSTAIATFYGKYNALPGDFNKPNYLNLTHGGNGNGILEWDNDTRWFWPHLYFSKILKVSRADGIAYDDITAYELNYARFRDDKGGNVRDLNGMMYGSSGDIYKTTYSSVIGIDIGNAITIASHSSTSADIAAFTPSDAFAMDSKIDDGNATTGKFRGSNARSIDGVPNQTCNNSGVYVQDEATLKCRLLYDFGL